MDAPYLHLEVDEKAILAAVALAGQADLSDQYVIRFEDLPQAEEDAPGPFDRAMDMVAQHLDLSSCLQAVVFVSPLGVFFRRVELPFSSSKKIRQVLDFELESLLPLEDEDHITDFVISGSKTQRGKNNKEKNQSNFILTASIPESQIRTIHEKLNSMGIRPRLITPKGYGAAIAYLNMEKPVHDTAFVHVTDQDLTLVLAENGIPLWTRSFPATGLSCRQMAARLIQALYGFNQRNCSKRFFHLVACIDRDREATDEFLQAIEQVFDPGSLTILSQNSHDLLPRILPWKKEKFLFNFCQGEYGSSSFIKKHMGAMAGALVLSFLVFGLFMTGVAMENSKLEKRIETIDNLALAMFKQTFPDKKRIQDPFLQMEANVKAALKKAGSSGKKTDQEQTFKVVELINELSAKIEGAIDVDASRFLFNNNRIVLSGSTDNFNNVDNIKGRIETSKLFSKVEISSAAADKKGNRVNFKFIIEM